MSSFISTYDPYVPYDVSTTAFNAIGAIYLESSEHTYVFKPPKSIHYSRVRGALSRVLLFTDCHTKKSTCASDDGLYSQ